MATFVLCASPLVFAQGSLTPPGGVRDCVSHDNVGHGILVNFDSTVSDCVALQNNGTGIITLYGITGKDCTANFNFAGSIITSEGCTVTGCTARSNGADGIAARANHFGTDELDCSRGDFGSNGRR
ncbi:MAG: right-handed parallel beta-helix repeat-containing protein [Verrucomicrobiota bacterium]